MWVESMVVDKVEGEDIEMAFGGGRRWNNGRKLDLKSARMVSKRIPKDNMGKLN